jgi:hypothetical protein
VPSGRHRLGSWASLVRTAAEGTNMGEGTRGPNPEGDLGPGAFIGHEPEREAGPDSSDVVEGPVGGASLREPTEVEADDAGADLAALPGVDGLGGG